MSDDLGRLFRQFVAFDSVTVECDRCETQAPLSRVQPLPRSGFERPGLICVRCLRELPFEEFERLRTLQA